MFSIKQVGKRLISPSNFTRKNITKPTSNFLLICLIPDGDSLRLQISSFWRDCGAASVGE